MKKYKTILFDMGNVVIDFSPMAMVSKFTQDPDLVQKLAHGIFLNNIWFASDSAETTDEDIINHAIEFAGKENEPIIREIMKNWHTARMSQNPKMVDLIKTLKNKGYTLILCTNAAQSFYSYEKQIQGIEYFDAKVVSSDYGLVKPHKEYFDKVFELNDVDPEECLFIDDSLINIQSAYQYGIDGYWYNGHVDLLKEFLQRVGVL